MADSAKRLISRIILDRDVSFALERGLQPDWFPAADDSQAFKFVIDHYAKYGEVPSGITFKANYPTYTLLNVSDTQEYLLDKFVDERRGQQFWGTVAQILENERDHNRGIELMRSGVAELDAEIVTSRDVNLVESPMSRFDEYLLRKNRPDGMLGIPTGFPTIDLATAGLQPGQLVTVIASPKTGKSQLALKIADHVHRQGHQPFYQSFEMSNFEQQERFDAMRAEVSHNRLRRGLLTLEEEQRYQEMLANLGDTSFILADSTSGVTVSAMGAKIANAAPALAIIDGVYLMLDETTGESNTPQALTNITRSFKRLAQRLDIPIIITTQTLLWKMRKNTLNENSIGYSSSFLQDSDVVLGLERIEDEDQMRKLKIVASRNCGPAEVDLVWDWGVGRFEELDGGDALDDDADLSEEFSQYQGIA